MDTDLMRPPAIITTADANRAMRIFQLIFRNYEGNLAIRLWNGETMQLGSREPEATLVLHHPQPLRDLILHRDLIRLAEAYFSGQISLEGDIYSILGLREYLQSLSLSIHEKASLARTALFLGKDPTTKSQMTTIRRLMPSRLRSWLGNSRTANRKAIAFHYDISNNFYSLWLDRQMIYSCAYFEDAAESLEQAQEQKLDHICRKLRLLAGERFLDIGCGWGALVLWAAKHYGVRAHGITLSHSQYEYGLRRICEEGLQELATLELKDYRDLAGEAQFDKIASVGMFEHVGLKNLPLYFSIAYRLLKHGGLFLNHGITSDEDGWKKTMETEFINRYVFPDGELDRVSNIQRKMENSRFEILDVEGLRPHYALTLRHWVRRLEARRDEALQYVSEATYRVWHVYMAACALQFEAGELGVYQVLAAKSGASRTAVPLTRRDVYR